ncbi:MAG: pyridoxamine 5'-phosphate oxidase family protein [Dehalococcoidia bacterium]
MDRGQESDRQEIVAFLQAHHAMTLATEAQGVPWVSIVFYACDGLTLYFITAPGKRLVQNLEANPRVAVSVVEDGDGLLASRGLQLDGVAELVTSRLEGLKARAMYLRRLGGRSGTLWSLKDPAIEGIKRLASGQVYRVRPLHIWLTDNSKSLGHRLELPLEEA